MQLSDINFDLEDKNVFEIDDFKLRAEAIRNSILPKLEFINNHAISEISKIYKLNVLEFSTNLKFPSFRKDRKNNFKIEYNNCESGIGGKRAKQLWTTVFNKKGENPQIIPFSLTFSLDLDGLSFYFCTNRYNLTLKNYDLFYKFHLNYTNEINNLSIYSKTLPFKYFENGNEKLINPFSKLEEYLMWQKEVKVYDLFYFSEKIKYPITSNEILNLLNQFIIFYPIYDNHIRLCSGRDVIINEQTENLVNWLVELLDKKDEQGIQNTLNKSHLNEQEIRKLIDTKIKVLPSIRWQVFQRDNWKCVSCGSTSDDEIILHIDHIIPRSKGGKDHIDNYQTLCNICNIGKSNKDQTDLRKNKILKSSD
jgi:hypothetical protein